MPHLSSETIASWAVPFVLVCVIALLLVVRELWRTRNPKNSTLISPPVPMAAPNTWRLHMIYTPARGVGRKGEILEGIVSYEMCQRLYNEKLAEVLRAGGRFHDATARSTHGEEHTLFIESMEYL